MGAETAPRSSIDLHTNSAKRHVRSHGADERRRQDERHAREVRHGHVRCLEGGRGPTSLGRPCEERGDSLGSHGRVLALPLQRLQREGQLHVHPPHSCLHRHCWCFCRPKNLHPLQGGYCYVRRHRKVQGGRGRGPSQGGPERKDLVEDQAACEEDRVDQWKTGLGGKKHVKAKKGGWVVQNNKKVRHHYTHKKEKERKSSSKCYQELYNVIFVS